MHKLAFILLIIGGLNWLLVGIFGNDLFSWIFPTTGMEHTVAKIVYILVGLAAIYDLVTHKGNCRACTANKMGGVPTV